MTKKMIHAKINGMSVKVPSGTSILDAAKQVQQEIPMLCKHKDLLATGACGLCIVKLKDSPKMPRACCTPLEEGMDITTHDSELTEIRRTTIELIVSNHPNTCLSCGRNAYCELQNLAADFGIKDDKIKRFVRDIPIDDSNGSIILDFKKCIKCGRCIQVCQNVQNVWALSFLERGVNTRMAPAGDISLAESPCIKCGQCAAHCPTGAIVEKDETSKVWNALQDPEKFVTVQIAPAVRVALGEEFGFDPGENLNKKIYTAFRRLGFNAVFDTNFSADLTIIEEASEFVERLLKKTAPLPLITSCCPAWTDYMEKYHNDMLDNFSTAKSPQQMLGALTKTYFAENRKLDAKKIYSVSIMPCTAKKYEISRSEEMSSSGYEDVDVALTTREFARMIKQAGIQFSKLPESDADSILGNYTGAGTLFGATGGVMEAALRTAYYFVTGENLKGDAINIQAVRGLEGVKEAKINIKGTEIRIAVAHGMANVDTVMDKVRNSLKQGEAPAYHFIEVMACPGGCIAGGGQPYNVSDGIREKRTSGLYAEDTKHELRCSHENPDIKRLYDDYLDAPLSEKSHNLLHTHYHSRPTYVK